MTSDFLVPSDWYLTFFTDPIVRFWDAAVPPAAADAEVSFIVRHGGLGPHATVLDVPCGTGRHSLPLARAGFAVTGIDLSVAALSRARERAANEGLDARFECSNMLDFKVVALSDALICMGNSMGYFEPSLTHRLLRKFASALRSGGRLIIDTSICAESLLPLASDRTFSFPGGTYEQQIVYDVERSIIKTCAQLTLQGERYELRYQHFVMTSGELIRLVKSAGFEILGLCGDTEDAPFKPGSPRLLLVATREQGLGQA
jgi:cyclopropane fatty-acyl-phospholipid synthase-like methyltransferase